MVSAITAETIKLDERDNSIQIISSSGSETVLQYNISQFDQNQVKINGANWFHISLPKEGITQDKGFPELPVFNRSLIIDNSALMQLEVYDVQYQDFDLQIAPSKGIITRNIDPATVPYTFEKIYQSKEFYPATIAELSEPYILRDYRGITIKTIPFAYNPTTQTLRVYTGFKIRVYAVGFDTKNILTRSSSVISRDFTPIYENHFLNWENTRYTSVSDTFGKLLVICHTSFMTQIAPYVNWKKQKGIYTELVEFSTIGTTAAQLKTYIQNRYMADNTVAFIQLVGDAAQIPTLASGGGGSDPSFALVAGSDNYPDIFIGRFSAATTADVTTQVNRTITYEKDLTTGATWLSQAMGLASAEGPGDNGEYDAAHLNVIRSNLLTYGYISVDQIYDPGAAASTVTTNVNAGRGLINYVGHGSDTSWGTTGFSNTNATALTNGSKTPFIVDVACVNGNFVSITCFAEAWLRNANGGAIAMYASSINQDWNPPMLAQDEVNRIMVNNEKYTAGGMLYNGSCKMMDTYGNTSGSSGVNMYLTWHIFGDASLMVRTKTPIAMSVNHPASIVSGTASVSVSTGVANALVAITYNNTIYARGFSDGTGNATLTFSGAPTGAVNYSITATAFNRVTYVGTIAQTVASGPYMEVTAISYTDGNNNSPEYNESGTLNITFKNSGTVTVTGVTATLTCPTTGITITDNTETISSLAAGASTSINNAFAFSISNSITDATAAAFTITMISGTNTWTYNYNLTINAPVLSFGSITITDPSPGNNNGRLDPGETVTVTMPLLNSGHATSLSGSGTLTSPTTGITINTGTANFSAIAASGSSNLTFNLTAAASMTLGSVASLVFNATAGAYAANKTEIATVGAPVLLTIGSGTSTQSYPIDRYYNYSTHESIYLASEIGTAGTIKTIGFYKSSGTDISSIDAVTIYMKNTTDAILAAGTYSTTGYTQVYSGTFPNTATSGWMEVTLNTGFSYNGTSNLAILIVKGYQAYISTYPYWTYTTSTTYRARQGESDTSQPTSLTASNYLPNMRLGVYITGFNPPRSLTATPGNATVTLNWQAPTGSMSSGYKVFRNSAFLATTSDLTYTDNSVVNGTSYSYYVTAVYASPSAGESVASNTVTVVPSTNLTVTIGTGTSTNIGLPIEPYYGYTYSQSIYLQSEINIANGTINKIYWYYTGSAWTDAIKIYLGHTSLTSFAGTTSWIALSNLTLVYNANLATTTTAGWIELTLSTPFAYNNTQNLVIAVDENTSGFHLTADDFYCSAVTGNRSILFYNDTTNPDPAIPPTTGTYLSTKAYIPNVKLSLSVATPVYSINQTNLAFGSVAVGSTSSQNFILTNTGAGTLTGTITPPTGFSVSAARDESLRSRLSYSLTANQSRTFTLTFAPTAVQSYNGSVTITSNDPNHASNSLAVTGEGCLPAQINVTPLNISKTLLYGNSTTQTIQISNSGSLTLNYTIQVTEPAREGFLSGSETRNTNWLNPDTISGSVNAGQSQNLTVTFISQNTIPGLHQAVLSISSNDPATPVKVVNASLDVTMSAPVSSVSHTIGGVLLNWGAVPGANTYRIFRSDSLYGEYLLIGTVTQTTFADPNANSCAFYQIRAAYE